MRWGEKKEEKGTKHDKLEIWQNGHFVPMKHLFSEKQSCQTEECPVKSPPLKHCSIHGIWKLSRGVRQGCWGSWAEITLQQGLFIGDISALGVRDTPQNVTPPSSAFAAPVRSPGEMPKLLQSHNEELPEMWILELLWEPWQDFPWTMCPQFTEEYEDWNMKVMDWMEQHPQPSFKNLTPRIEPV